MKNHDRIEKSNKKIEQSKSNWTILHFKNEIGHDKSETFLSLPTEGWLVGHYNQVIKSLDGRLSV